jgi:hypothetical protein
MNQALTRALRSLPHTQEPIIHASTFLLDSGFEPWLVASRLEVKPRNLQF